MITPEEVEHVEFQVATRGYDFDQVDAFLDQVADSLRRGQPGAAVPAPRFDRVLRGYDVAQVDAFLGQLGVKRQAAATSAVVESKPGMWRRLFGRG